MSEEKDDLGEAKGYHEKEELAGRFRRISSEKQMKEKSQRAMRETIKEMKKWVVRRRKS